MGHRANTLALFGNYLEVSLSKWSSRKKLRFSLNRLCLLQLLCFLLLLLSSFFFLHLGAWVWDVCHVDFVGFGDVGLVQRRIALTYMMQDGFREATA